MVKTLDNLQKLLVIRKIIAIKRIKQKETAAECKQLSQGKTVS